MTNTRKRKRSTNNNNNISRSKLNNFGMPSDSDIGVDLGLENLIENTVFTQEEDPKKREQYISHIPDNHPCEWGDDFQDDSDTFFLLQKDERGDVKGAVAAALFNITPNFIFNDIPFYYIDLECSWGVSNDIFHTWGRILWANILHVINRLENNGMFVVYNDAIPTAAGYHYKMGMRNLKTMLNENNHVIELKKPNTLEDIKYLIYKNHEKEYKRLQMKPNRKQINNDIELGGIKKKDLTWNRGNMFYMKRQDIEYDDLYSIILSLSNDSEMFSGLLFGGTKKTKTGKKKKKNKKNNKTSKNRKHKKKSN